MYPTTFEEQILKALVTYQYLTAPQVMLITQTTSLENTEQRLRNLSKGQETRQNYIWRVHRRTTKQNLPLIPAYTYSIKTRRYLEKEMEVLPPPPYEPDPKNLDHDLALSDVLLRIHLLELLHPDKYKVSKLKHERALRRENLSLPTDPDGFVVIADLAAKQYYPFLLEVDMTTEMESYWKNKIDKHLDINGRLSEDAFGFRHPFRLVVTKPHHVKTLKQWTEEAVKKKGWEGHEVLFDFTSLPDPANTRELKQSKATRERYIKNAADEFLLAAHFLRGGSNEPVYLFSR